MSRQIKQIMMMVLLMMMMRMKMPEAMSSFVGSFSCRVSWGVFRLVCFVRCFVGVSFE